MSVMDGYEASKIIVKRIEKRIYPKMTIIAILLAIIFLLTVTLAGLAMTILVSALSRK